MTMLHRLPEIQNIGRRGFLSKLGISIGAAGIGAATGNIAPSLVNAAAPPAKVKGTIPDKPYVTAHMRFCTVSLPRK